MSDELKIGADTAENELLAKHLAKFAKSLPYERSQAGEAREEALRAAPHGEDRANFKGLVLGCIEAKFCK